MADLDDVRARLNRAIECTRRGDAYECPPYLGQTVAVALEDLEAVVANPCEKERIEDLIRTIEHLETDVEHLETDVEGLEEELSVLRMSRDAQNTILRGIADLVLPLDRDVECTDTPYWLVVTNVCGGLKVQKGVFFSRDAAERHLKRFQHRYPATAYVDCLSGSDSDLVTLYTTARDWREREGEGNG